MARRSEGSKPWPPSSRQSDRQLRPAEDDISYPARRDAFAQNLIILLRVIVTLLVIPAGPPFAR